MALAEHDHAVEAPASEPDTRIAADSAEAVHLGQLLEKAAAQSELSTWRRARGARLHPGLQGKSVEQSTEQLGVSWSAVKEWIRSQKTAECRGVIVLENEARFWLDSTTTGTVRPLTREPSLW